MGVVAPVWCWIYMVSILLAGGSILGGVGAALAIHAGAVLAQLDAKTPGRVLQYLGSRSYSIFLVHMLVGSNVARLLLRGDYVTKKFFVLDVFFIIALAATLVTAEVLFRFIELPTHRLAEHLAFAVAPRKTTAIGVFARRRRRNSRRRVGRLITS